MFYIYKHDKHGKKFKKFDIYKHDKEGLGKWVVRSGLSRLMLVLD